MQQILVYVDQGVDGGGLKQLIRSLKQEIAHHPIVRIDAKTLMQGDWEEQTALLIVPGGRDCFYHTVLNGIGTDRIRGFVQNGGGYLGICAGAYFACESIEFEKGEPLEVCGERSLKFYPGVAKGPAYGNNRYSYECAKGAEAAHISWKDETCRVYFNGGCTFESPSQVEILSRYLDLSSTPPAIVQVPFGQGKVILSGVHFEYDPTFFSNEDPHLAKISPDLIKAEMQRRTLFREILAHYGLSLSLMESD